jgi:hypothetical protein
MRTKLAGLLLAAALASACGVQPREHAPTWTPLPFDEAEYAALPKTGTDVVRGQVLASTGEGQVRKGAREEVLLIPATTYRDQWYIEKLMQGKAATAEQDARYSKYDRRSVTDADGRFEFIDVPPGPYYVLGRVVWSVAAPGGAMQGGLLIRKVQVENGRTTQVNLLYK